MKFFAFYQSQPRKAAKRPESFNKAGLDEYPRYKAEAEFIKATFLVVIPHSPLKGFGW